MRHRSTSELTRASFSAGLQGAGDFSLAYNLGGSFGPGKSYASDVQRLVRFQYGCRCWRVATAPHRSAH